MLRAISAQWIGFSLSSSIPKEVEMQSLVIGGLTATAVATAAVQFGIRPQWRGSPTSHNQLIEGWANHPLIPGVILRIVRDDEIIFDGAAGSTTLLPRHQVTPATSFHIASIGKLFTAVAVMRLWESGILDIDAPVSEFLEPSLLSGQIVVDGFDYSQKITARQLLGHTAGFANTDSSFRFQAAVFLRPQQKRTPEQLVDRAKQLRAIGKPDERQNYASPGYYLLGRLLESITGLSYHQVVRREILSPLGLNSTWESNEEWRRQQGELHHYLGLVDLWRMNPSFEYADGGFVSTTQDLTRFGQAIMDGTVFRNQATLEAMCRIPSTRLRVSEDNYYGLGIQVSIDYQGKRLLSHQGFWGTGLVMRPENQTVMAYAMGQANAVFDDFQKSALYLTTP